MAMMGYAAPANWSNALAIMGAALKDASPGSNGDALAQTQNLLAQRSMMNARLGLMQRLGQMQGGQPVSTVDQVNAPAIGRNPGGLATTPAVAADDPRWQQIATDADMLGMPLTSTMEALKLSQPHITVTPSGEAINDKSAANVGRVFPKLDNGIVPTRDPNGNLTGASALPGYADAAASIAGATTGAQEQAKAPWTLVDVPTSDGSTVKMPLSIAASVLTKNFTQPAPAAATGASAGAPASPDGASPGQIGRTPTPAETTLANNRATTQGELEKSQPASKSALTATDNLIGQYTDQVQKMLGETYDPKTGKWAPTQGAKPMVNDWSAGRLFGHFPALTGQATNLEAALDGIRALISSEKMGEVRQDSQGASNNLRLTQGEIFNIFGNLAGPLHQTQDPEALKGVLRDSVNRLRQSQSTMHNQYDQQYNQIQRPTPGSTQPIPPKAANALSAVPMQDRVAEARRRGLIK